MSAFPSLHILTLAIMLTACGVRPLPAEASSSHRPPSIRIELTAHTTDDFTVVVRSGREPITSVIPSIKLRNSTSGEEFWSPFDEHGEPLVLNGRVSFSLGVTHIPLRLSSLKWARSRAALWPSGTLQNVVPSGEYEVVARVSPIQGESTESATVRVLISTAK